MNAALIFPIVASLGLGLVADDRAVLDELVRTWQTYARPDQIRPDGSTTWAQVGGRGIGKNRSASETTLDLAEDWGPDLSGLIAGRTAADTRESMIYGVSGLRACARRRGYDLAWSPARMMLTHPSGAAWRVTSGEVPDGARGANLNFAWLDELSYWQHGAEALSNIDLAFRADAPSPGRTMLLTLTPNRKDPLTHQILADDAIVVTRAATSDNAANLSPGFVTALEKKYGGTTLAAQEMRGELIAIDGVVCSQADIAAARVVAAPDLDRIVVAVDPGGAGSDSDETGIVIVGVAGAHGYVLADLSVGQARASEWARVAVEAWRDYGAGRIIVESNFGGDAMIAVLETAARDLGLVGVPIEGVHASKSKRDRAEPVGLLYEQSRIHHVGIFEQLEKQLTQWVAAGRSPDRLDALVHGAADLMLGDEARVADPGHYLLQAGLAAAVEAEGIPNLAGFQMPGRR